MKFFKPDAWSGTHLFGSFFLSHLFQLWLEPLTASAVALTLGVFWECLDQVVHHRWLDSRGGDWGDVLADLVGVTLAVWV